MYANLRDFVAALDRAGELVRISAPVSPVLEIAAIADRVSKSAAPVEPSDIARRNDPRFWDRGGPALLFENVEGSDWPVLINAFGSYSRMEAALGCARRFPNGFDGVAGVIGELAKPEPPRSLGEAIAKAKQFAPLLKIAPKTVKRGICQEVVVTGDDIDLRGLPLIRCWPHDGDYEAVGYPAGVNDGIDRIESGEGWDRRFRGRYITLGGIHTIHADDEGDPKPRSHNIGMYRVQLFGKRRMAMHWHVHHDGAAHWRSWKKKGKPMPVAIALGGEGVLPYGATAPLPPGISELLMAGFLNGRGIPLVPCKTVPLRVPANAEVVIEGWVSDKAGPIGWDPREAREPLGEGAVFEGPFGDHTGFYSMPDRYPILDVTAVTHRRDPIYPTTIVGLPPQEDYYLGKATERLFLPLLQVLIPDIEDYDLPMFGAFHNCVFVRIRKQYPMQARRVMHAIWGAGQMAWTKTIFVVDEDVDVHDTHAVLREAARRCDGRFDVERATGPLDILDHAAPWVGAGGKMGFDCTRKWPGEEISGKRAPTGERAFDPSGIERIRQLPGVHDASMALDGWVFVSADSSCDPATLSNEPLAFVVMVGVGVDVHDPDRALFHWVANADMRRDVTVGETMVFDARPKAPGDGPVRAWPPLIEMSDEVLEKVERRWAEYGIDQPPG